MSNANEIFDEFDHNITIADLYNWAKEYGFENLPIEKWTPYRTKRTVHNAIQTARRVEYDPLNGCVLVLSEDEENALL